MANSPTIQTDDYGDVTVSIYRFMKRMNVSPSDYRDIEEAFGTDWAGMKKFIQSKSPKGYYLAPWPFSTAASQED